MTHNMGKIDRTLRLVFGLFLLMAPPITFLTGISVNPFFGYLSVAIGVVLLATALIRFCPLYRVLNLSTDG